jgi:putative ABC transport system ATP-binding protein
MQIELRDLSLKYEEKETMFEGVSLSFTSQDFVLIRGQSGSGKSSLLRLMNRLQEPTSGKIVVDGKAISNWDVTALRRAVGYVQQTPVMVGGTVRENLLLPFQFKSAEKLVAPSEVDLERWMGDFLLNGVTLSENAEVLSVGQKQRIALIRTLLTEPAIVLCDEPTSALDPDSKAIVEGWLERIHLEQNVGVVLVTHVDFKPEQVTPRRFVLSSEGLKEA